MCLKGGDGVNGRLWHKYLQLDKMRENYEQQTEFYTHEIRRSPRSSRVGWGKYSTPMRYDAPPDRLESAGGNTLFLNSTRRSLLRPLSGCSQSPRRTPNNLTSDQEYKVMWSQWCSVCCEWRTNDLTIMRFGRFVITTRCYVKYNSKSKSQCPITTDI